ncbi:MAG: hypothetical protein CMP95_07710 [Gammaproteobacteria bacterium]|nr:hypothetical protein [Gammaproteobacteria bacterium]OUV67902.1 MAG: hypothetical protein CBC93_04055 [Gammaproteobacteria bacterium TMED133]
MTSLENTLEQKNKHLKKTFKQNFLQQDYVCFQFLFKKEPPFYLIVEPTNFSFRPAINPSPTVRLYINNHCTCWNLLEGEKSGFTAFMEGKYYSDGHIVLSQRLLYLFNSKEPSKEQVIN